MSKFADCIRIEKASVLSASPTHRRNVEKLPVSIPLLVFVIRDDQLDLCVNGVTVSEEVFLENLLRQRPGTAYCGKVLV